jgi:4-amino-4-deoxy-L-arabinose transferase-like glycosyltransferase
MRRTNDLKLDSRRIGSLVGLVGASAIYLLTLAPTVQGFDSAELTVGACSLGFVHAPGYPLYMVLGHAFALLPLGNVGERLNLMSAVFASLAVLLLFRLTCEDSDDAVNALPAVLLFATTPIFWSQALRAEVYTLHTFLMIGTLYLWRRAHQRHQPACYLLAFLVLGLGMGNHPTTMLLWLTLVLSLIWETPRFRWLGIVGTAGGVVIAGMLYLYFPLRSLYSPGIDYITPYFHVDLRSPAGVWWLLSAKMFQHEAYWSGSWLEIVQELSRFGASLSLGYLGVGAILGLWGWLEARKKALFWNRLLTIYFAANVMAFAFYHVADKEVMFIPAYAVWAIWVTYGIRALGDWLHRHLPALDVRMGRKYTSAALMVVISLGIVANWHSTSLHGNRKAYEFATQLLAEVETSTLVVNGWTTASVLDYLRLVEDRRPDVQSFNLDFYNLGLQERHGSPASAAAQAEWRAWLESQRRQRPLCFLEPLPAVPSQYEWTREGTCWKLIPSPGSG